MFKLSQYSQFVGEKVKIRLRMPYEGRKNFAGTLSGVEGDDVVVAIDDEEFLLPFEMIDRAQVQPQVDMNSKSNSKKAKPGKPAAK